MDEQEKKKNMTFERENLKDVDSDVSESKKEDDALAQEKIEADECKEEASSEEARTIEKEIPVTEETEPEFSCSYEPPYGAPILSSVENASDKEPKEKKKKQALIATLIVIGVAIIFVVGAWLGPILFDQQGSMPMPSGSPDQEGEKKVYANFSEVYGVVADSVVDIDVFSSNKKASGSGVIIHEDGHIITNYHVVENFSEIVVRLRDGSEYSAFYIGGDAKYDIAVIKINPIPNAELVVPAFGKSSEIKVAEDVIAIGNPLGMLSGTVTKGIISAEIRKIRTDFYPMDYLQIDAPINNGNSGGAVFNLSGELIGIVTAKVNDFMNGNKTVSVEGLGFAIPIDVALRCAQDLIQYGYVTGEPELGISFGSNNSGVVITESRNDQLYVNDKIVAINDKEVKSMEDIYFVTDRMEIGDEIKLTIRRGYSQSTFDVVITVEEYQPKN